MAANPLTIPDAEAQAEVAFSAQSGIFDAIYSGNTIVNYKRERVRSCMQRHLKPGSRILELNSGTGEDALYFAAQGHFVHATDVSTGMQRVLTQKVAAAGMSHRVTHELCSFTQLHQLKAGGKFDAIFSNFGGLNCTDQLDRVLASLPALLNPGGTATLVIIPKFCLWEVLLMFKGKFRTAFRRFFAGKGRAAHIEGEYFKCWYYSPSYVISHTRRYFEVAGLEGLCTIVPPSYIESFAEKHPRKYAWLKAWEDRLKAAWPWKYMGDYFIITLKLKDSARSSVHA